MAAKNSIFDPARPGTILLLAILLTIIAAIPRLYQLGELGFSWDEETTSFASRSMAETGHPRMPSGMPYYRAFPQTWLNAISANYFGLDNEFSYRLPAVIFGIFTIPLLFLLARPYVGAPIAFMAALLLAFSEWHIITSRQARMYAPFLFFYVAYAFSVFRWAKEDSLRNAALTTALFIVTISFHTIGIFGALIPLATLYVKGYSRTPQYKLITFSFIAIIAAQLFDRHIISAAYQGWRNEQGIVSTDAGPTYYFAQLLSDNLLVIALGITGLALGVWLGRCSFFTDSDNAREFRILSRYLLAILFGVMAASGNLHAAFLSILLLALLYPGNIYNYLKQTYKPVIAISGIAIIASSITITEQGIVAGIKSLLVFPYPNWITLYNISPGITLLFLAAMLFLAACKKGNERSGVVLLLVTALLPLIIVGVFKKWAAARYLLEAYPFMLAVSAFALMMFTNELLKKFSVRNSAPAKIAVVIVCLSGILGGHGLLQAYWSGTIEYGNNLNLRALSFPFYPDHKYPGLFVAKHRKPGDIVVAEDVLQQRWYAGKIDYWLRRYGSESGGHFLYKGKDLKLHDIYINTISVTPDILSFLANNSTQRIWLITSGETYFQRDIYLKDHQLRWLENIESTHKPVFTGKDKITKVYCLNCSTTN
jgi:4-amino-4-deoxy-L-arabinose transferase-like glycosyltransferase